MFPQVSYVSPTSEFTIPQVLPVLSYFQAFTQAGTEEKNYSDFGVKSRPGSTTYQLRDYLIFPGFSVLTVEWG